MNTSILPCGYVYSVQTHIQMAAVALASLFDMQIHIFKRFHD